MSDALFQAAKDAMAKCYAPYSDFPVGAAILTSSGAIYAGANMENQSSPEGWCAETSAIAHMIMAGEREITQVAVIAAKKDEATPCGGCRQRLAEFSTPATKIHLCNGQGIVKTMTMADLLPAAFKID